MLRLNTANNLRIWNSEPFQARCSVAHGHGTYPPAIGRANELGEGLKARDLVTLLKLSETLSVFGLETA